VFPSSVVQVFIAALFVLFPWKDTGAKLEIVTATAMPSAVCSCTAGAQEEPLGLYFVRLCDSDAIVKQRPACTRVDAVGYLLPVQLDEEEGECPNVRRENSTAAASS
jgi:hypothetical protein